jgi:hypothetical protein
MEQGGRHLLQGCGDFHGRSAEGRHFFEERSRDGAEVVSADRDKWTDASRDGSGQTTKGDVGYELSFAPITVWEEKQAKGYQPGDTPLGAKKARPMDTGSTRGARDI